MKKLIIAVALLAASLTSSAQIVSVHPDNLQLGARVFFNLTSVQGGWSYYQSNVKNSPTMPGAGFGAIAVLPLPQFVEGLGVRGELLFNLLGEKSKFESTYFGKVTQDRRLYLIQVPLMLQYKFSDSRLTLLAGPDFGLVLGGTVKETIGNTTESDKLSSSDYLPLQIGLGLGAEYELIDNVLLDARYNFGLSKLWNDGNSFGTSGYLSVGLAYMF